MRNFKLNITKRCLNKEIFHYDCFIRTVYCIITCYFVGFIAFVCKLFPRKYPVKRTFDREKLKKKKTKTVLSVK